MNLKFIKVFLRTINTWLWVLCLLSIATVFVMDMWLLDIPAPYKLFEAMGKFNYGVSVSYIAAFIFYLISVHYPDTKSAVSHYTSAHFPAKAIVTNIEGIFTDMGEKLGMDVDRKSLNEQSIKEILSLTKCYSDSTTAKLRSIGKGPIIYYSWLEYLDHKKSRIEELFKQLYPIYPKLDGEYIRSLSDIEQSNSLYAILSLITASILSGKTSKSTACFDQGLEDILLELYNKAVALDKIISERDQRYDLNT